MRVSVCKWFLTFNPVTDIFADPPEVQLKGMPSHDLEEGKDTLTLRCLADANPPASVIWQRVGSRDISSLSETLVFKPINQRDSGTYSCTAKNSVGTSQPVSTTLDVKCKYIYLVFEASK